VYQYRVSFENKRPKALVSPLLTLYCLSRGILTFSGNANIYFCLIFQVFEQRTIIIHVSCRLFNRAWRIITPRFKPVAPRCRLADHRVCYIGTTRATLERWMSLTLLSGNVVVLECFDMLKEKWMTLVVCLFWIKWLSWLV
jgi:hypothetical protein